jgi:hypothetical protein
MILSPVGFVRSHPQDGQKLWLPQSGRAANGRGSDVARPTLVAS